MLYRHTESGVMYRVLFEVFDVQAQRASVVYVQVETGFAFVRDKEIFMQRFTLIDADPQSRIAPKQPKDMSIEEQLDLFKEASNGH